MPLGRVLPADRFVEGLAPLLADPARDRRPPPVHVQRGRGDRDLAARDAGATRDGLKRIDGPRVPRDAGRTHARHTAAMADSRTCAPQNGGSSMTIDSSAPRSRRALLAAAAGSVAAVAASAALPLGVAAAPTADADRDEQPVRRRTRPSRTAGAGSISLQPGMRPGPVAGIGVLEARASAPPVSLGWSVVAADLLLAGIRPGRHQVRRACSGRLQRPRTPTSRRPASGATARRSASSAAAPGASSGFGGVGVEGDANYQPGSVGVWAYAPTNAQTALEGHRQGLLQPIRANEYRDRASRPS